MPSIKKRRLLSSDPEPLPGASEDRPKILFFGDPHGDFEPVLEAVKCQQPDAIILLGDLQARRPLHLELAPILDKTAVWFVHGNHDTDSDEDFDNVFHSELADRNLDGEVQTIAGYRVAGLGGVFRDKVWNPAMPLEQAAFASDRAMASHARGGRSGIEVDLKSTWRGGILRKHHSSIFPDVYQRLCTLRADILVTHEAPAAHAHGFTAIDELANRLGATLVVHGHHHESINYLEAGLITVDSPFLVHGVDKGDFLAWPPKAPE
ncbi:metallophosphoesterase [Variovorax sp. ZS18.2.2]|uniref:metallophosphoesterase family protein n=1 Tax=Variovorax sp. ZS18.2.2 TaxID=2971255 RepID=UPI002150F5BE|nr:metallophosphoesterase [Variovorax sp. ZS18.2.2]MCR6480894.1 metallophosphoesterase [Variovorax sp. ZS18.2.2]